MHAATNTCPISIPLEIYRSRGAVCLKHYLNKLEKHYALHVLFWDLKILKKTWKILQNKSHFSIKVVNPWIVYEHQYLNFFLLFWHLILHQPEAARHIKVWNRPPKSKNNITNTGYYKQKASTALQVKLNFKIRFSEVLSYCNIWMKVNYNLNAQTSIWL